jgi:hypothetical protein
VIDVHFVILGALISFTGGINYLVHTLRGKTSPNRVTWLMWALAPLIAFSAEIRSGVGLIALTTFMAGFMPLLIFIATFIGRHAVWELTRFDLTCGALSLVGLGLWLLSGEGTVAIVFSIVADGLAAIPTLRKSYTHPASESWFGFATAATNAGITLLTITVWSFANYGFPLYLLLLCVTLTVLIKFEIGPRLRVRS